MQDSSNYAVAIRTIRDAPEHKKRTQQAPAAPMMPKNAPRIPKVGLRQPGWQLLRYLFGKPYLNPFAEDAMLSPEFLELPGF